MDTGTGIRTLSPKEFPPLLHEISDPPKQLFVRGILPTDNPFYVCIVGSRRHTRYGRDACEALIAGLAGIDNIVIVSGLALGIDGIAHRAALSAGIRTIAVPGSGLSDSVLYPATHRGLAQEILKSGGALLSEFKPDFRATLWSFPRRNRIMAGISCMTLLIEADEHSGSLITARLGLDYNRIVAAVPGPINSSASSGTNALIKDGATPICKSADILEALGVKVLTPEGNDVVALSALSSEERLIFEILTEPLSRDEIIQRSGLEARRAGIIISLLESKGYAIDRGGMVQKMNGL